MENTINVPVSVVESICSYCENQSIYDKLSDYNDFYYKLKALMVEHTGAPEMSQINKEIACTINTGTQLAHIMGVDYLPVEDIYIKTHERCPDITPADIFNYLSRYNIPIETRLGIQVVNV